MSDRRHLCRVQDGFLWRHRGWMPHPQNRVVTKDDVDMSDRRHLCRIQDGFLWRHRGWMPHPQNIREGKIVHLVLWKIVQFPPFLVEIALILGAVPLHFPEILALKKYILAQVSFLLYNIYSNKNIALF